MKLSRADRLMLWYQMELLKHVHPDSAKQCEEYQEVLERGYESFYGELAQHIDTEPVSAAMCNEVTEILNMYRALDASLRALKKSHSNPWVKFKGFDGNNETEQFGFASFLFDKKGHWQESADCPRNSHSATLGKYRAMLDAWRATDKSFELTDAQIEKIVTAK